MNKTADALTDYIMEYGKPPVQATWSDAARRAAAATRKAHAAGKRTDGSDDRNEDAADAHMEASKLHEHAAKAAREESRHKEAKLHDRKAHYHEEAGYNYAQANESENSMNEPKDFIICQESGVVLAGKDWKQDVPVSFQWMPGGVTTICAHYNGKPIELTVNVTSSTAKAVQASFGEWFRMRPKQSPFACIEHREQEAAMILPKDVAAFEWRDTQGDADAGIYCTAVPTGLGARNVNERVHNSWSPSFTTDADYARAKVVKSASGREFMIFPRNVRGSRENPAEVTGCAFSVGSLTNKPAFRNINPVKAVAEEAYEPEIEADDSIQATWSDSAREKALEARRSHAHLADQSRRKAYAHEASARAYQATIHAHTEGTARHHLEAAKAHQEAAGAYEGMNKEGADRADEHHGYSLDHYKMARAEVKKKVHSSEAPTDKTALETVYASLAPNDEDLQKIYAKLAEPKDPLAELYDRLSQPEAATTAGQG